MPSHVVNSSRLAHSNGESFVDDAQGGFEERICVPGAGAEELPGVAERGRSEASALLDYSEKSAFGHSWRWFHTTPREFRNRLSTV